MLDVGDLPIVVPVFGFSFVFETSVVLEIVAVLVVFALEI